MRRLEVLEQLIGKRPVPLGTSTASGELNDSDFSSRMVHVSGTSVSGPIERGCPVFQQHVLIEQGVIGVFGGEWTGGCR